MLMVFMSFPWHPYHASDVPVIWVVAIGNQWIWTTAEPKSCASCAQSMHFSGHLHVPYTTLLRMCTIEVFRLCMIAIYPLIKPPVRFMTRLVRTPYYTSGDFPELSAYYSLTPVALISGKVFYRIWLVGRVSCQVVKWLPPDLNRALQPWKGCVLTFRRGSLVRFIWAVRRHLRLVQQATPISFLSSQGSNR